MRCPECGTDLDEVPFVTECLTHRLYDDLIPGLTDAEIEAYLDDELARILGERFGDD